MGKLSDKFSKMAVEDIPQHVKSKDDFVEFLYMLVEDFKNHSEEWENQDLENYLEGLYGSAYDIEGYYKFKKEKVDFDKPTWEMFSRIFLSARVYE